MSPAVLRRQIEDRPAPFADFSLGPDGARTLFSVETLTALVFNRQVTTAPGFTSTPVPVASLGVAPGAVGKLAFGRFLSPEYETADKFIPEVGSATGASPVSVRRRNYARD